jgi:hypothetical protein
MVRGVRHVGLLREKRYVYRVVVGETERDSLKGIG